MVEERGEGGGYIRVLRKRINEGNLQNMCIALSVSLCAVYCMSHPLVSLCLSLHGCLDSPLSACPMPSLPRCHLTWE